MGTSPTGGTSPKVDLKQLIASQLIRIGDAIECKKKCGRITAEGEVEYLGKVYKYVSSFAHSCGVQPTVLRARVHTHTHLLDLPYCVRSHVCTRACMACVCACK